MKPRHRSRIKRALKGNDNARKTDESGELKPGKEYRKFYPAFGQKWNTDDDLGWTLIRASREYKTQKEFLAAMWQAFITQEDKP